MRIWMKVLQASGWCFGAGAVIFIVIWLESVLEWGWSTAGNWGYFLLWLFISAGLALVSAFVALIAGIAMLILRGARSRP